jgi:hypothetical protein
MTLGAELRPERPDANNYMRTQLVKRAAAILVVKIDEIFPFSNRHLSFAQ